MNLEEAQRKYAIELVECGRARDQNALGTICAIRENAKKGNPRARATLAFLNQYVDKNPMVHRVGFSSMGEETKGILSKLKKLHGLTGPGVLLLTQLPRIGLGGKEAISAAATILANGPWLTHHAIFGALENVDSRVAESVSFGFEGRPIPDDVFGAAAQCINTAVRIQQVRLPGTPISILSPMAGWELGE